MYKQLIRFCTKGPRPSNISKGQLRPLDQHPFFDSTLNFEPGTVYRIESRLVTIGPLSPLVYEYSPPSDHVVTFEKLQVSLLWEIPCDLAKKQLTSPW